jgi:AcrR family transcriptional regulator
MRTQLGRSDWILAAAVALGESGVEGVRVEPLARRLGVTKGSFYWHFRDRQDLLDALLATWEDRNTFAIIDRVEAGGGGAEERLWRLFEIVIRQGSGASEEAIRTWARSDPKTAAVLRRVDGRRLEYLEGLFAQMGFSAQEADARSRLVYCALIGEWAMNMQSGVERRLDLAALSHRMLIHRT